MEARPHPCPVWASWRIMVLLHMLLAGVFQSLDEIKAWMTSRIPAVSGSTIASRPGTSGVGGRDIEGFVIRRKDSIPPSMSVSHFHFTSSCMYENPITLSWLCHAAHQLHLLCAGQFDRFVAKFVRRGHVQTPDDWLRTWKQAKIVDAAAVDGCTTGPTVAMSSQETSSVAAVLSGLSPRTLVPGPSPQAGTTVAQDTACGSDSTKAGTCPSVADPDASGTSTTVPAASVGGRGQHLSGGGGRGGGSRSAGLKLPKLLVLVGLPGSGKSTFAERLVASGRGWVRVSQDECGGSRRTCESAFGIAALRGSDHNRHVILDRWAIIHHSSGMQLR